MPEDTPTEETQPEETCALVTLAVEIDTGFYPDSRRRTGEAPNPFMPYAGQAFAWWTDMTPAEREALIERVRRQASDTKRKHSPRKYTYD
jgi:hypothetical protein